MGNCGSYFRGAISPVFALGCSKIVPGSDYNLKSIRNTSFLGLIVCGMRGNDSTDLKSADFRHYCTPGRMEAHRHCGFQFVIDPGEEGGFAMGYRF